MEYAKAKIIPFSISENAALQDNRHNIFVQFCLFSGHIQKEKKT
jgi:hypothetical protein